MKGTAGLALAILAGCVTAGHGSVRDPRAAESANARRVGSLQRDRGAGALPDVAPGDATSFLVGSLRPWPDPGSPGLLAVTDRETDRVASYDSALVVLALLRAGDRDRAGRILVGLSALQTLEGGLAFSFTLPRADPAQPYERSGAIAWAGYAATEYLDAGPGGAARTEALALAHRAAGYLLRRQVDRAGDPRTGLVTGGVGDFSYDVDGEDVREIYDPAEVAWASVEHNVDSFFFLRSLARITGSRAYAEGAERIRRALAGRAWDSKRGQFLQGVGERQPDPADALDCASWGSVFLSATGDAARAHTALSAAQGRYVSRDPQSGARGHRPYASGFLIENAALRRRFGRALPVDTWDRLEVVWPEGSAGVALAEWRAGHRDRAVAILDALEPLRRKDGALPTASVDVPFTLDARPSVAATAWVALVRFELDRRPDQPTLWP
jgi:hypothetical protein